MKYTLYGVKILVHIMNMEQSNDTIGIGFSVDV